MEFAQRVHRVIIAREFIMNYVILKSVVIVNSDNLFAFNLSVA